MGRTPSVLLALLCLLLLCAGPLLPSVDAAPLTIETFADGTTTATTQIDSDSQEVATLELPANARILDATLQVEVAPPQPSESGCEGVTIDLGGHIPAEWAFVGRGYGALGNQTRLADSTTTARWRLLGDGTVLPPPSVDGEGLLLPSSADIDSVAIALTLQNTTNVTLSLDGVALVQVPGSGDGTATFLPPGSLIQQVLDDAVATGATTIDGFGTSLARMNFTITAAPSEGNVTIAWLAIHYAWGQLLRVAPHGGFWTILDSQLPHVGEGTVEIPVEVAGTGLGTITLRSPQVVADRAPRLVANLPPLSAPEDSAAPNLLDLADYLSDDGEEPPSLQLEVSPPLAPVAVHLQGSVIAVDEPGKAGRNWTGTVQLDIRAADVLGQVVVASTELTILPVNDAPQFVSVPASQLLVSGQLWQYQLRTYDADGDGISLSLDGAPAGMVLEPLSGLLTWVPTREDNGTHLLRVRASDPSNASAVQVLHLQVRLPSEGANALPMLLNAPPPVVRVGEALTFVPQVVDDDGDTVTISVAAAPPGSQWNATAHLFSWTPTVPGTWRLVFVLDDGLEEVEVGFDIVARLNALPTYAGATTVAGIPGEVATLGLGLVDPDGDLLHYRILSGPLLVTVDAQGQVRWLPREGDQASANVSIEVTDGYDVLIVRLTLLLRPLPPPDSAHLQFSSVTLRSSQGRWEVTGAVSVISSPLLSVQLRRADGSWSAASLQGEGTSRAPQSAAFVVAVPTGMIGDDARSVNITLRAIDQSGAVRAAAFDLAVPSDAAPSHERRSFGRAQAPQPLQPLPLGAAAAVTTVSLVVAAAIALAVDRGQGIRPRRRS